MRSSVIEVGPSEARDYLLKNRANRPLRQVDVEAYSRDMVEGRWELTHQGIAFDTEGNLIDGQHRLNAIIKSGVTIPMMVTEGVENKCNIDTMVKRTARDILGANPAKVFLARFFIERRYNNGFSRVKPTISEIQLFIDKYAEPLEFVATNMNSSKRLVTQVAVKAAICSAYFYEPVSRLEEFCETLLSGYSKGKEDVAVIRFREFLFSPYYATKSGKPETYKKACKAIKLFCQGKYIEKLVEPARDPYPKFSQMVAEEFRK